MDCAYLTNKIIRCSFVKEKKNVRRRSDVKSNRKHSGKRIDAIVVRFAVFLLHASGKLVVCARIESHIARNDLSMGLDNLQGGIRNSAKRKKGENTRIAC